MIRELRKVEELTDSEKSYLDLAKEKLLIAQSELFDIKAKIAKEHNMFVASWPEFTDTIEIDSGYILFYRSHHAHYK